MINAQNIIKKLNKMTSKNSKSEINKVKAWVDNCGDISDGYIIIQGWAFHPDIENIEFNVSLNVENQEIDAPKNSVVAFEVVRATRLDVNKHFSFNDSQARWGFAIIAEWPFDIKPSVDTVQLELKLDNARKIIPLTAFNEHSSASLFGHCVTWRSEERLKLMAVIHSFMGAAAFTIPGLKHIEEAVLRRRVLWNLDNILAISGYGIFVAGWLLDDQHSLAGIFIRAQDGSYSDNLLFSGARYPRKDVLDAYPGKAQSSYQAGLFAWTDMPHLMENAGLELVIVTRMGELTAIKLQYQNVREEINLPSQQVLVNFDTKRRDYHEVMKKHIGPALSALWGNRQQMLGEVQAQVHQFGPAVLTPKRSIIVPLYGRYDFLLHQIAQFSKDPDFSETELIYVLDDPKLYSEFLPFCHDTSKLFPVAFKVIYGGRNLGYAGANNLGAQHATAKQLVLLNSDVIPSKPGWLNRIESEQHKLPKVGVVAPKLVFEDGSIQHLGMSFAKLPQFGGIWFNEHPGKGTPEWLSDIEPIIESAAVTGACMFISKALYLQVGGLDEIYVLGDFEDSDLCLKLRSLGYKHYVLGNEKLYHLERQSQDLFENRDWKFKITLYNAWQHTQRWGKLIEELVA